jgi:hypothetical protein
MQSFASVLHHLNEILADTIKWFPMVAEEFNVVKLRTLLINDSFAKEA